MAGTRSNNGGAVKKAKVRPDAESGGGDGGDGEGHGDGKLSSEAASRAAGEEADDASESRDRSAPGDGAGGSAELDEMDKHKGSASDGPGDRRASIANLVSGGDDQQLQTGGPARGAPYGQAAPAVGNFPPFYGYGGPPYPMYAPPQDGSGEKEARDKDDASRNDAGGQAGQSYPPPLYGGYYPSSAAGYGYYYGGYPTGQPGSGPAQGPAPGPGPQQGRQGYPPANMRNGSQGAPFGSFDAGSYPFYDNSALHALEEATASSAGDRRGIRPLAKRPVGKRKADDEDDSDSVQRSGPGGATSAIPVASSERPYPCSFDGCTWSFARLSDQRRHLRSHQKPTFQCPYWESDPTCHRNGGAFNRLDVLKRHLRLVHFVQFKQSDSGWCRVCQKMFPTPKHFVEHCDKCARNARPTEWKVDTGRILVTHGQKGRAVTITDAVLGPKDSTLMSMSEVDTELKSRDQDPDKNGSGAADSSIGGPGDDTPDDDETTAAALAAAAVGRGRARNVGSNRHTLSQGIRAGSHLGGSK